MTKEQYVKMLITNSGHTAKSFAASVNLPYSTLLGMLNRGLDGAAVSNVFRVCRALSITVEDLERVEVAGSAPVPFFVSDLEKRVVVNYRNMPEMRVAVDKLLDVSLQQMVAVDMLSGVPDTEDAEPEMMEMKVFDMPAAAGFGNYLSEDDEFEMIPFPAADVPRRADFGIRISGDSMEPTIEDGSIVWVQAMPAIENGEVGIFILDGSAYCKRLHIDGKRRAVFLCSENEAYDDIPVSCPEELRTVGRVL